MGKEEIMTIQGFSTNDIELTPELLHTVSELSHILKCAFEGKSVSECKIREINFHAVTDGVHCIIDRYPTRQHPNTFTPACDGFLNGVSIKILSDIFCDSDSIKYYNMKIGENRIRIDTRNTFVSDLMYFIMDTADAASDDSQLSKLEGDIVAINDMLDVYNNYRNS